MSLTLEETDSLVAALGVKIPESIRVEKAKAEEFKLRREKVAAEADGKPADWRLQHEFEDVLKRAAEIAGQNQFDSAFELLNQAGQLLLQPDAPPPPTAAPAPAAAPPSVAANLAGIPDDQEFQKAWSAAKATWENALATVDAQIGKLQQMLRSSSDEELREIAEFGLNGVTGNFKVPLLAAMQGIEGAHHDTRDPHARRTAAIAAGFLKHIENEPKVEACDENPFGIQVSIRKTIGVALAQLTEACKLA